MTREIKFRAWNKNRGMFDCEIISLGTGYETWRDFEDGGPSSDIVMQYTGVKDRNEKEIYEVDILKTFNENVDTIVYEGSSFILQNTCSFDWTMFEVIGNIYQNKELIK
jgi:hypothetical protein